MKAFAFILVVFFSQFSQAGLPGSPILEGEPVIVDRGRPTGVPTIPPVPSVVSASGEAIIVVKRMFDQCNGTIQVCPAVEPMYSVTLSLVDPILGKKEVVVLSKIGFAPKNIAILNTTVRNGDKVEFSGEFYLDILQRLTVSELTDIRVIEFAK